MTFKDGRDYWIHGVALASVARMIAEGRGVKAGVHFSAEATDAVAFLEELRRRGVTVEEKLEQSNESERLT